MDNKIKDVLINILLFIVLVLLLAIPAYLCYRVFLVDTKANEESPQTENIEVEQENLVEEDIAKGPLYEEFFPIIDNEQAYVVVPTKIDSKNPPTLIIYSHGSNTNVTQNMEDQFMKDLLEYGIFFTQHNYIFAASNQHGVNWGNQASVRDTLNLKQWVMQNYDIKSNIYMIGFSMGGLPTLNFASENPEMVAKIALLAPTTRTSEWNQARVEKIKGMEIKIWHGNADVNVPYSTSVNFVNAMNKWGKEIPLVTLQGKTHWDVDTQYMEDILDFFSN